MRRIWPGLVALLLTSLVSASCDRAQRADGDQSDDTLIDQLTSAPRGVQVHLVRLVVRGDTYAFEPSEIGISSGDLVRFVLGSAQPQSVAFGVSDLSAEAEQFVREQDLLHGELLTSPGETYDVSFQNAPPGRYPFHSIVHAERGMRGVVVVDGG
jgi:plastocyanin